MKYLGVLTGSNLDDSELKFYKQKICYYFIAGRLYRSPALVNVTTFPEKSEMFAIPHRYSKLYSAVDFKMYGIHFSNVGGRRDSCKCRVQM